jgi:hypothetical protein
MTDSNKEFLLWSHTSSPAKKCKRSDVSDAWHAFQRWEHKWRGKFSHVNLFRTKCFALEFENFHRRMDFRQRKLTKRLSHLYKEGHVHHQVSDVSHDHAHDPVGDHRGADVHLKLQMDKSAGLVHDVTAKLSLSCFQALLPEEKLFT